MVALNGQTALYGIIGEPIAHSLSPLFQNHFIKMANIDAAYLPFLVTQPRLSQALNGLHAAHIQGLNITVPHKENVLPLVTADKDATMIGAVNTLKRVENGDWLATNTDWQGFADVLQGLQAVVSQTPILLFGAGGTARAICHALQHQGAKDIWLCNRSPERAQKLADELNIAYAHTQIHILDWDTQAVAQQAKECAIVINSSSIGLHDNDEFPFKLEGSGIAIDAVYKPHGNTAFTRATSHGYLSTDGLPMLIAQGIASFKFWHQSTSQNLPVMMPNQLSSLAWVEQTLSRPPLTLPGWRT